MSHTHKLSSSEKSSKSQNPGILRIFRQSVRTLGQLDKVGAGYLGKQSAESENGTKLIRGQTDHCTPSEKSNEIDVQVCIEGSQEKKDEKTLKVEKKADLCRKKENKPWPSCRCSPEAGHRKNGHTRRKNKNNNFAGLTSSKSIFKGSHKVFESVSHELKSRNEIKSIHVHNQNVEEDWDKEVEKDSEKTNIFRNAQTDVDNVNKVSGIEEHSCNIDNVNSEQDSHEHHVENIRLVEGIQGISEPKKSELEFGGSDVRSLKSYVTCNHQVSASSCSPDVATETFREVVDSETLEDKQNFEDFSADEGRSLEEQDLPLHSTPKKVRAENLVKSVVKKTSGVEEGDKYFSLGSLSADEKDTEKGFNSRVKQLAETNSTIGTSEGCDGSMGRRRNAATNYTVYTGKSLSFKRSYPRGFEKPPRFSEKENEKFRKNENELRDDSYVVSQGHSRNSGDSKGSGCHDGGSCVQQEERRKVSIFDLNVKTPDKWKNDNPCRKSGKLDRDNRNRGQSQWMVPVSEDWSFEMYDTNDVKNECCVNSDMNDCKDITLEGSQMKTEEQQMRKNIETELDLQHTDCLLESVKRQTDMDKFDKNESAEYFSTVDDTVGEKNDSSTISWFLHLPDKQIDCINSVTDSNETSAGKVEPEKNHGMCTVSLKQEVPYLPPVPEEVTEYGEETNETFETFVTSDYKLVKSKSDRIIESDAELKENRVHEQSRQEKIDFGNRTFEISEENGYCNEKNNMKSSIVCKIPEEILLKEHAKDIAKNFKQIDNENRDTVSTSVGDQSCMDEKGSSETSDYATRGHRNTASEADVSDLLFDESQIGEIDLDRLSCGESLGYAKSVEEIELDARTLDTDVYQTELGMERYNYEQYARYWYEQDVISPEGQFGPWHPNYPYNYETYRRWYEQKQYEMNYYWDYYYRHMQFSNQMSAYNAWDGEYPYPAENAKEEIESCNRMDNFEFSVDRKLAERRCEVESKSGERVMERNPVPNAEYRQHSKPYNGFQTNNTENTEGTYVSDYWSENMYQWVKNQSPGGISNSQIERSSAPVNIPVDRKIHAARTACIKQSVSGDQQETDHRYVTFDSLKGLHGEEMVHSEIDEPDITCRCKPSQRVFIVWRVCECEAGKTPKLHTILSKLDDRSLDLGYQSYESLEPDVSADGKRVGQKASGFVIQPLLSTPTTQNSSPVSNSGTEKGKPVVSDIVGEKAITSKGRIKPPPGFERVEKTQRQKGKTGMKKVQGQHTVTKDDNNNCEEVDFNSQYESNTEYKISFPTPSLRSRIEQEKLRKGLQTSVQASSNKGTNSSDQGDQYVLEGDSSVSFMENGYSSLPRCLSDGVNHLKNANMAIAKAEKSQEHFMNSLQSAVDMKITELEQRIYGYDATGDTKTGRQGSLAEKECDNFESVTSDKGKELVGLEQEMDSDEKKIEGKKELARKPNVLMQHGSYKSALKGKGDDAGSTSGDENLNISVYTQSPLESDDEDIDIKPSKMLESHSERATAKKKSKKKREKRVSSETSYKVERVEIPVNEMLLGENMQMNEAAKSQKYTRVETDVANRPRMSFRPRSQCFSFPYPYRGGMCRPLFGPVANSEHRPLDPRYSFPPPPLRQWPPPPVYQMQGTNFPLRPRAVWEDMPHMYNPYPDSNLNEVEKEPSLLQRSQSAPYFYSQSIHGFKVHEINDRTEETKKSGSPPKQRNPLKLVDYGLDSGDESSTDIEPFDTNILSKPAGESHLSQCSQPVKPLLKKQKTDTDDDTSSVDSADRDTGIHQSGKTAVKLSRGQSKKLKQKSLKSFTSDKLHSHHKVKEITPKKQKDLKKTRSLSEIIAETESLRSGSSENIDSVSMNAMKQEFPPLGSDPKKQLSPLPPLPPFPNSPFWSMFTPANNSALTGKSQENQKREGNSGTIRRRSWQPSSPFRRYSFSPAGASGLNSPSETDSETASIRSDWRTNFKVFHNFGVKYIDTHCHLDFIFSREGFKGSFKGYMEKHSETFPDMFEGCVAVFCNPDSFTPSGGLWLDVAKEPNVWIAMGCHPKMATEFTAAAELGLKKCLRHIKCIALGEIGLDYSGTFYQHAEVQKQVFRRQLKIAIEMAKVLVIHCRQAEEDCLEIMKEMVPPKWKIHCHCFTNSYDHAKLWIDAFPNLFIGVTPLVTYKTAKPTHDLARNLPITKLLLETDSPYFIPRCIPREDLQFSNPGLAVTVAKEIAQYQELPVAAVLRQCRLNTNFMYGI